MTLPLYIYSDILVFFLKNKQLSTSYFHVEDFIIAGLKPTTYWSRPRDLADIQISNLAIVAKIIFRKKSESFGVGVETKKIDSAFFSAFSQKTLLTSLT